MVAGSGTSISSYSYLYRDVAAKTSRYKSSRDI